MNSLVLTRWRPDKVSSGDALRICQNIRGLASLGDVDVVSIGVDKGNDAVEGVRAWTALPAHDRSAWERFKTRAWLARPGACPGIDRFRLATVTQWIRTHVTHRRYDAAVIESIVLTDYLDDLKAAGCRVVFDAHNVESVLLKSILAARASAGTSLATRYKHGILQRRLEQAERRVLHGSDVVWVCSEEDAQQLSSLYGPCPHLKVVPNGVDLDSYGHPTDSADSPAWQNSAMTLLYVGSFGYLPNEDAAMRLVKDVLPAVRTLGYKPRVLLVGRDPTRAMLDAARQDPAIEVTGAVTNVRPYLCRPCVVTLPIALGSGTRLKILEAFAAQRPVVSTKKGAEGLRVVDNEHLLIRDEPRAIARGVVDLWTREQLRRAMCLRARALVESCYSWSIAADRIRQSLSSDEVLVDTGGMALRQHTSPTALTPSRRIIENR